MAQIKDLVSLFFSFLLVLANIFLWIAVMKQLKEARRASQGTILLEANRDFFFSDRMYRVRKAIESKKPILKSNGGQFTEQDLEDYIGYFEMLYGFTEQKILNLQLAEDNFGAYVEEAWVNKEVREYIGELRRTYNDEDIYIGSETWGKMR